MESRNTQMPVSAIVKDLRKLIMDSALPHLPLECGNRYCAQHRDLWRHYEDVIGGRDITKDPARKAVKQNP